MLLRARRALMVGGDMMLVDKVSVFKLLGVIVSFCLEVTGVMKQAVSDLIGVDVRKE